MGESWKLKRQTNTLCKTFSTLFSKGYLAAVGMMLVNSGCDDRVLSKTNDRRTSNNNSDKTTRGM